MRSVNKNLLVAGALVVLCMTIDSRGTVPLPSFEQFPADTGRMPSQRPVLKLNSRADQEYRSALRIAATRPPNVTGHYILTNIGCGASCVLTAAMDARNGSVNCLPFSVCCWKESKVEPVQFRLDSELIILEGLKNETQSGPHYVRLNKGKFTDLVTRN